MTVLVRAGFGFLVTRTLTVFVAVAVAVTVVPDSGTALEFELAPKIAPDAEDGNQHRPDAEDDNAEDASPDYDGLFGC